MNNSQSPPNILVDSHVHIHECFALSDVLDSSLQNFQTAAHKANISSSQYLGVLILTEIGKNSCFQKISGHFENGHSLEDSDWTFQKTHESESLYAHHASGNKVLLLAGHQVVTQENIEVLSIISDQFIDNGMTVLDTIHAIQAAKGIPVLPWGFGKWFGSRGKIIHQLIQARETPPLLLGDNSNRPNFWINPVYLKQARKQAIKILPGTDPLPLVKEASRPGRFGFQIQGTLDLDTPGSSLKDILLDSTIQIQPYGALENPLIFLQNQLKIRL